MILIIQDTTLFFILSNILIKNSLQVEAGKILQVPIIASEQYPEKLGHTVKDIDLSHSIGIYSKTLFSMATPEIKTKIAELYGKSLESIVLFGLETHICVEQTAMDFRNLGYDVHVVADCSMSRSMEDRVLAFERLKQIGCFVTTSESVIFKLMKDKNHGKFNDLRKLVATTSVDTELSSKL